jgi:SAM-dependent methyltransferase
MAVEILKSKSEYRNARAEMRRRGIDFTGFFGHRLLRKVGFIRGATVGDQRKSWDVWKTVQFIERNIPPGAAILDIGAYASEVLCALHKLRYTDLTGIDINPKIHRMPFGDAIRYVNGDFMHTSFPDSSYDAITAISVIEHGFNGRVLLAEISRLLKPDGHFLASVDYWPEKVDSTGLSPFGIEWRIFSEKELRQFLAEAKDFGLEASGIMNFDAEERTVKWYGKRYTFAWMVLRKSR